MGQSNHSTYPFGALFSPFIYLLMVGLGAILYGDPTDLLTPFNWQNWLGSFLIFLSFFWSLLCWGQFWSRLLLKKKDEICLWPGFGSLFFSLIIGLLYLSSVPPVLFKKYFLQLILFVGPWLYGPLKLKISWPGCRASLVIFTFVGLLIVLFIGSSSPSMFWDPLWYHLTAPREWFMSNVISFNPQAISLVAASYWEHLYLWGQVLLSKNPSTGALAAHLFGQWTHLFVGVFGTLGVLFYYIRWALHAGTTSNLNLTPWILLGLMAALTDFPLHYASLTAKNDWGVMLWFFTGLTLFAIHQKFFWAGLFVGVALVAKGSYVFLLPIAALFLFISGHRRPKNWALACAGALLGALPIMLRNYFWTQNPVFPYLTSLFPSPHLGPTFHLQGKEFSGVANNMMGNLLRKIQQLVPLYKILNVSFLLILIPFVRKHLNRRILSLWGMAFFSLLLFALATGPRAEFRVIGAALVLFYLLAYVFMGVWLEKTISSSVLKQAIALALTLHLLLYPRLFHFPHFKWNGLFLLFQDGGSFTSYLRKFPGQSYLDFVHQHLQPGEKVFILEDTKRYYFTSLPTIRVWDSPSIDRQLNASTDPLKWVQLLRAEGGRFLVDSLDVVDNSFNSQVTRKLIQFIKEHPKSIVYATSWDWVVDLKILEQNSAKELK